MSVPDWLAPLARLVETIRPEDFQAILPLQDAPGRASAVLMLFWHDDAHGIQVLLIERSDKLRSHAGQPAFPGGALDPEDDGPVAAALRETVEETGLDPAGVEVLGCLPDLFIPVSNFRVTPVLAWWREPSAVHAVDEAEVASVHKVRLADLVDPENRLLVRHAASGRVMSGFAVNGMLVWGFTAGVLDHLIRLVGWERPWSREKVVDLSDEAVAVASRTSPTGAE